MKNILKLGIVLMLVTTLFSCGDKNVVFDESVIIPNSSWDYKDLPYFDVEIEDTLSSYAFYFNIRHLENYSYSNFYTFLHITFPNGHQVHDTIEFVLAYPDGQWIGKGSGSMRSSKILLNRNLYFPLSGRYRFEIEQAMREPVLEGVTDVGIRFEKIEN